MKGVKIAFSHASETISGAFGISDERFTEIKEQLDTIVAEEEAKEDGTHAKTVEKVLEAFDEPNEAIFAIYMLNGEEESVGVTSLYGLFAAAGVSDDDES